MAHLLTDTKKKKSPFETITYEFPYMRPPNLSGWEKFMLFIYNPHTKEFCSRTAKRWGQLFIYFVIYFIILISMFSICMQCLFNTLSEVFPKWQLAESCIGIYPGLAFRPMPENAKEKEIFLISYDPANPESVNEWTSRIDGFLQPYQDNLKAGFIQNLQTCDFGTRIKSGKVCTFEPNQFGPCGQSEGYGYNTTSPCVFLKINKIFGWVPEPYNDIADLPEDMPEELMKYINSKPETERNQIWVSCKGIHEIDKERFNADLDFFPTRGFPSYYYPYMNIPGYMSPVVAVQFKNVTKGVLVDIECRIWAKNMKYKSGYMDRIGSTHIQLKVQ